MATLSEPFSGDELTYTEGWTEHFRSCADVELVLEGTSLLAHSTILCQSHVLAGALQDTTNPQGRIRIESMFAGVPLRHMDLLLSQLYATSRDIRAHDLSEMRIVLHLSMKCGFDGLAKRVLNIMTRENPKSSIFFYLEHQNRFSKRLTTLGADDVYFWVDVNNKIEHEGLEKELVAFFSEKHYILSSDSACWLLVQEAVKQNPGMMQKILSAISFKLGEWENGIGLNAVVKCHNCLRGKETVGICKETFMGYFKTNEIVPTKCTCGEPATAPFFLELNKK